MSRGMSGSSTQSMDSLSIQTLGQQQVFLKTELMKHFTVMNKASIREIMLRHEKTFKEQVHDLHKLYEVQRLLMQKCTLKGSPTLSSPSKESSYVKKEAKIWEPIMVNDVEAFTSSSLKEKLLFPISEAVDPPAHSQAQNGHGEKQPAGKERPTSCQARKRKIDLEQLPEDDSDDEVETEECVMAHPNSTLANTNAQTAAKASFSLNCDISLATPSSVHVEKPSQVNTSVGNEAGKEKNTSFQQTHESCLHIGDAKNNPPWTAIGTTSSDEPAKHYQWMFQGPERTASLMPAALPYQHMSAMGSWPQRFQIAPAAVSTFGSPLGKVENDDVASHTWYMQGPAMQCNNQYLQQHIIRPQAYSIPQSTWLRSSDSMQGAAYSQHYATCSISAPSQTVPRMEASHIGPWDGNLSILRYNNCGFASADHKPPFRKPPKLVLKNSGGSMEWVLVSPEGESDANITDSGAKE